MNECTVTENDHTNKQSVIISDIMIKPTVT